MQVSSRQSDTPRDGYTLIEIMLALSVLVATLAIVWPPLTRMYASYVMDEAVADVQERLGQARFYALDESIAYQFRFEPEGQNYLILPYDIEPVGEDDSSNSQFKTAGKLKEDMQFQLPKHSDKQSESLDGDLLAGLPDKSDLESVAWSKPILFFADGTSEDKTFLIEDKNKRQIQFDIRGLTGAVTMVTLKKESAE